MLEPLRPLPFHARAVPWRSHVGWVVCALLCAICASGGARAQNASSQSELPLGLWFWSADEPTPPGRLVIEKDGPGWRTTLGGEAAWVTNRRGVLSIEGPDGARFVGGLTDDESQIRGYWHQPASPLDYQNVATPTVLPATADGTWAGDVVSQQRPYAVFLDVFEDEDGAAVAAIRNRSGNNVDWNRWRTRFCVEAQGDGVWSLVSGSGDQELRLTLERAGGGRLALEYYRLDDPVVLQPVTGPTAERYYSRLSRDVPAQFTPPPSLDDGWTVAAPEDAGFDRAALDVLTAELAGADPRSRRPRMVHSLLVARGGRLVYEEYFFGHDREDRHDVRSLGKVFGSVLVGALQQQGHAIDADYTPIPAVFERAGRPLDDPRKADITLGDLMTFTSGLDCSGAPDSPGNEERMWEQQSEDDYWVYTSTLEVLHEPGARYAYCSGSANLVGAGLSAVGGARVHDLFDRLVARPLDFGTYHFPLSPNGEGYLGGGMYMRPRDVLKIGAVYLDDGTWNGQPVVDPAWIAESTVPRIDITPGTTGTTPEYFAENYAGGSQAYIWLVDTVTTGDRTYTSYQASGNGGQLLIVVPELDLAVVLTGGNYGQGGIWSRWRNEIVGGHIIPAMTDVP